MSLNSHWRKVHHVFQRALDDTSTAIHCPEESCSDRGPSAEALRKHTERKHSMRAEMNTPGYLRCAYCDVHTSTHLSYIEHVRTIHNGNHTIDHKCLDSEDDFKGWLISLKKKFGVDFVKRRGDKNTTTGRTVRMFCSRSGSATESSKLTQSGIIPKISIRCGKDCTAFLLAHVTESSINVQYCLEHAGHIIEAEDGKWMRLSTEERNWILALLRDNRSADYIMEKIGSRKEVPAYDRLQYFSRRDIYNIDPAFANVRHKMKIYMDSLSLQMTPVKVFGS